VSVLEERPSVAREHPQALPLEGDTLELPSEQLGQGNWVIPLPSKAFIVVPTGEG
jgi:hypothetical protein